MPCGVPWITGYKPEVAKELFETYGHKGDAAVEISKSNWTRT